MPATLHRHAPASNPDQQTPRFSQNPQNPSRTVPDDCQCRVIAVDIQQEMLDFLTARAAEFSISNVVPHLGAIDDVKLPLASIAAALMVDAYHECSHPREMLASLHSVLKPGGRIFLLEFRGEDPRVPIKPLHKMTEA